MGTTSGLWRLVMIDSLGSDLRGLFESRRSGLDAAMGVKAVNDRVDALTLLCREVLRSSSLCFIGDETYSFTGRCYAVAKLPWVQAVLGNVLVDLGVSPTDVRRMGDMPLSVIGEKVWVRDTDHITFENGVFCLSKGVFSAAFDASVVTTEMLPYAYDPKAECPRWETFLKEVLPDAQTRAVLQEFFGMMYVDRSRISIEKFALLVGKGANGKSVVGDVITGVVGHDNVTNLDTVQMRDEKMLPNLAGKRLNFVPDMPRSKDFDSALKALASGQDVIGRKIYGEAQKVVAPPLCFALNEMPVLRDQTEAFFRRMLLFSFRVEIPSERQDRTLAKDILAAERPGIFRWIIEGRNRLLRHGGEFSPCEQMEADIAVLRHETQGALYPVKQYLEGRGLRIRPSYDGQPYVMVSQNEIALALHDTVSRYQITAELRRFGVQTFRSKELFYKVYQVKE